MVALDFDTKSPSDWVEQASPSDRGRVIVRTGQRDAQLQITSARDQDKKIVRRIDASSLRRKRVVATVQADVQPREQSASACMRISLERAGGRVDAWDFATSQRARAAGTDTLQAAIDVPEDAASLSVELEVKGDADVRFGTPHLEISTTGSRDPLLTDDMTAGLRSLAQLVGYLRFFHPSDQVAHLAWPDFEAEAVRRVLMATGHVELREALQWVVERAAPTARLHEGSARPRGLPLPRAGTRLTRWVRVGSGNDGDPYSAFRSGISEPSDVGVTLLETVHSQGCTHATVRLAAKVKEGSPVTELYIIPRRGSRNPSVTSHVLGQAEAGFIEGDIPSEVTDITYGVRIGGVGVLDVTEVELACNHKTIGLFSSGSPPEIFGTAFHLYTVTPIKECAGCVRVARHFENAYELSRDEVDVPIGHDLHLQMPLVLWTDGTRTFPEVPAAAQYVPRPLPPGDLASRLASAIDIWMTLRWFYPYFDDLHIDWDRELMRALISCAGAKTGEELFLALSRLVAAVRDDHAVIYRPDYDNGILPLLFRELDSKLYFVKGIGEYNSVLPRGSTLVSLDGMPADDAIKQISSTISAATPAWLNAYLPLTLGDGPTGIMLTVTARQPDGELVTIRVPRIARSRYLAQKRDDRPASGTEVATGVYYVDLSKADDAMWKVVLPKLGSSRAVICDVRDGASSAGFLILAYFIDHEIKSPYWDKPVLSLGERKYERTQSSIFPLQPRLSTKLIFLANGRTASSPETILQYARAAGLGIVIGEPTGGTNGDVAAFDSLHGVTVRFTGLRVLNQDGSAFHGHGITPDVVVHPTLAGIRDGRDEILEAAISRGVAP